MSAPGRPAARTAPSPTRAWIAVALWTLLVWTLSSDAFSAGSTSRIIEPLVRWLWPEVRPEALAWIHFLVRKSAHVTEYAILGVLALRALRLGSPRPALHSAALALAFAATVAAADEARQTYVPSRTATPKDVALDTAGAALGIAGALLLSASGRRRR